MLFIICFVIGIVFAELYQHYVESLNPFPFACVITTITILLKELLTLFF